MFKIYVKKCFFSTKKVLFFDNFMSFFAFFSRKMAVRPLSNFFPLSGISDLPFNRNTRNVAAHSSTLCEQPFHGWCFET